MLCRTAHGFRIPCPRCDQPLNPALIHAPQTCLPSLPEHSRNIARHRLPRRTAHPGRCFRQGFCRCRIRNGRSPGVHSRPLRGIWLEFTPRSQFRRTHWESHRQRHQPHRWLFPRQVARRNEIRRQEPRRSLHAGQRLRRTDRPRAPRRAAPIHPSERFPESAPV